MVCGAPICPPWSLQVRVYGACSCIKCGGTRGRSLWGACAARSVRLLLTIRAEFGVRRIETRAKGHGLWGGRGRRAGLRSQKVMTGNGLWGRDTAGHGLWGRRERSWFVGRIRASNSFRLKQRSWPMGTPVLCAIGHGLWGRPHARAKVMVCGALKWSWFVGKI